MIFPSMGHHSGPRFWRLVAELVRVALIHRLRREKEGAGSSFGLVRCGETWRMWDEKWVNLWYNHGDSAGYQQNYGIFVETWS